MLDLRILSIPTAPIALLLALAACGGGGSSGGGGTASTPAPPSSNNGVLNSSIAVVPITAQVAPAIATRPGSPALPQASATGPNMNATGGAVLPLIQTVLAATNGIYGPDTATMDGGVTLTVDLAAMKGTFNAGNPALAAASVPLVRTPNTVFYEVAGKSIVRLQIGALDWTAYGNWSVYPNGDPNGHSAQFVTGFQTPNGGVPTVGTATYSGAATGETSGTWLSGTASLEANFATGSLTGTLTQMEAGSWEDGYLPWNSVSLSAAFGPGQSSFSGSTAVTSAPDNQRALRSGATGTIAGSFFGPNAQEVGAVWTLFDGTKSATGTLAARVP